MRRLTRKVAAFALAATPVFGVVAVVHPGVLGGGAPATASGSGHVLADNGVIDSRN